MPKAKSSDSIQITIPKMSLQLIIIVLFVLLVISLSGMAYLFTRLQGLENTIGTQTAQSVNESFKQYAKKVGLDEGKFTSCLDSNKYKAKVDKDAQEATQAGATGTPAFFINGVKIGGAYPFVAFKDVIDKELSGESTEDPTAYIDVLQAGTVSGSFDPVKKDVGKGALPVRGDKNAKVVIIEFSDFQCPFCQRTLPTIEQVLKEYKGKVVLYYRHLPLTTIHKNAQLAAEASECANEQGKFWEYHDVLFENQTQWENLPQI